MLSSPNLVQCTYIYNNICELPTILPYFSEAHVLYSYELLTSGFFSLLASSKHPQHIFLSPSRPLWLLLLLWQPTEASCYFLLSVDS